MFECLTPISGTFQEGIGGVNIENGLSHFKNPHQAQSLFLFMLPMDQDIKFSATAAAPFLFTTTLSTMMIMNRPFEAVSKHPIKCFLL